MDCHPFDQRSYFESVPFFENLDSALPFNLVPKDVPSPKPTLRQQVLERLLANITAHNLVGKVFVEQYLRDQYPLWISLEYSSFPALLLELNDPGGEC